MLGRQGDRDMPGIELLRFLAALSILILHYENLVLDSPYQDAIATGANPRLPFFALLGPIYTYGYSTVQLFWLISGFVMMRRYGDAIQSGAISAATFAWRRFSRLYPLHLLTLLAIAALQALYVQSHAVPFTHSNTTPATFFAHLLMASNWFSSQPLAYNWPVWSVSVEVVVYALFFLALCPCRIRVLAPLIARLAVMIAVLCAFTTLIPVLTPALSICATLFVSGSCIALLVERPRLARLGLPVFAVLFVGLVVAGSTAATFAAAAFLILFAAHLHQWLPSRPLAVLASLGDLTYASYLLHLPIQIALALVVDAAGLSRAVFLSPPVFLAYLAIVLITSFAIWKFFEIPAQYWLRGRAGIAVAPFRPHILVGPAERSI